MTNPTETPAPEPQTLLLHELVPAARARLDDAAWDYLIGGAETETTVKRNRLALDSLAFRPRVLRDVSSVDASSTLFGDKVRLPVFLAPIGSLQDFEPGGGATAARGAARFGVPLMLSSVSDPGLEETAAAADGPKIYQLYVRGDEAWTAEQMRRARDAGYRAFCFTVDTAHYSRRERDVAKRVIPTGRRKYSEGRNYQQALTWKQIAAARKACDMPLILKGIATAEDARLAVEHGVDVVYVSNHGGRQLDFGRGSIDVVPEVLEAVRGKAEVLVDGGFTRGTDVLKALALGARAVGLGRLTGLAMGAGGEDAVVRMLELLEAEMITSMGLLGVTGVDELGPQHLHAAPAVGPAHVLSAFPLLEQGYGRDPEEFER